MGIPIVAAGPKNMLLCLPGFPGTTAQAQPYVDKMLRHLETDLGYESGSMTGAYLPDGSKATAKLKSEKPGFVLMGPSVLAENNKSMTLHIIAKVEANGRGQETYYVVTKKGGPSDLSALVGKTVSGTMVHDEKYVYNVVLDQNLPRGTLTVKSNKRPLKSLRDVVKGNVDAAIVDQSVIDHMKELKFGDQLQVIYTSKPVPAPAVVVLDKNKKYAKKLKKALVGLCQKPSGKDLCKSLTITSIKASSNPEYQGLLKRYNR